MARVPLRAHLVPKCAVGAFYLTMDREKFLKIKIEKKNNCDDGEIRTHI